MYGHTTLFHCTQVSKVPDSTFQPDRSQSALKIYMNSTQQPPCDVEEHPIGAYNTRQHLGVEEEKAEATPSPTKKCNSIFNVHQC